MAPKKNLEQYLDSGNLDLSMSQIEEVPIGGIAALSTKVKSLDLSCNTIVTLSETFPSKLSHLVKLDLSKNQITQLPDNFGLFVNLRHLDLYSNKLESLPLSFANLKSLKWLDVKKNPLMPKLAEIAGECQDEKQCKAAAKNVVAAFQSTQEQVNLERARRKEEQLKTSEKNEEDKQKLKESNSKKKKKKAKSKADNMTSTQTNGNIEPSTGDEHTLDDNNEALSSISKQTKPETSTFFNKVGCLLSFSLRFIMISSFLVLVCGFILSLIDEDLYKLMYKKGHALLRSKIPKVYLKYWDIGLATTRKAIISWSRYVMTLCSFWFTNAQDYFTLLSNHEIVQLYLERIQSGWHIFWIYMSDKFTTLSDQLFQYFQSYNDSPTEKS